MKKIFTAFLSSLMGIAAYSHAQIPAEAIIYEGVGVGNFLTLGDTREEIAAMAGSTNWCQSLYAGDLAYCSYPVPGGAIQVQYRAPDYGNATASDSDIAVVITVNGAPGWYTTAGINNDITVHDPDQVIAAYPNGVVTGPRIIGQENFSSLRDESQGISFDRHFFIYSGLTTSTISVFPSGGIPQPPENPEPEPTAEPTTIPTIAPTPAPTATPTATPEPSPSGEPVYGNLSCEHRVVRAWRNGFRGDITITNTGSANISGWQVSWAYDSAELSQVWNAQLQSKSPNVATNLQWNGTLAPGASATFGFIVSGGVEEPSLNCEAFH